MRNAEIAEREGKTKKGIMGILPLSPVLDLVDAVPLDYMHTVLLGVVRMLLTRWFDSSYHTQPFYLGCQINAVDSKLLQQHPPSESSCRPRSIQHHLKYLKASELKTWLLFIHGQFYWITYPLSIGITMLYW